MGSVLSTISAHTSNSPVAVDPTHIHLLHQTTGRNQSEGNPAIDSPATENSELSLKTYLMHDKSHGQETMDISSSTKNNEASTSSVLNSAVELKHCDLLENKGSVLVKTGGLTKVESLSLKASINPLHVVEDTKEKKKKCSPLVNDVQITNDPTTSLTNLQDGHVGDVSHNFVSTVYSLRKKRKKEPGRTHHEVKCVDDTTTCNSNNQDHPLQKKEDLVNSDASLPDSGIIVEVKVDTCSNDYEKEVKNSMDIAAIEQQSNDCEKDVKNSMDIAANEQDKILSNDCDKEVKNKMDIAANGQDKILLAHISSGVMPVKLERRKLLVLDVNGLLVDIVSFQPHCRRPDVKVSRKSVYKRPFCDEFLNFCFKAFDVGIWSSRVRKNLNAVVDFLMGDDKDKLLFCWDQSQCTVTGFDTIENTKKPLFLKELRKIWDKEVVDLPWERGEFSASNTLLLDDSPYKALLNPPYTAIFPRPYCFEDENDNSLGPGGDLRIYLEGLAETEDVATYVREHPFGQGAITEAHPSWPFYLNIVGAVNPSVLTS